MRVLYFASIRDRIGLPQEELVPPPDVTTVAALLDFLVGRSPRHAGALSDRKRLKIAVNQDYADIGAPLAANDEVAIFPPVTGG